MSVNFNSISNYSWDPTVTSRDGHLWECKGCSPGTDGGKIYQYRLRDEYDGVTSQNKMLCEIREYLADKRRGEIFPVVEYCTRFLSCGFTKNKKVESILNELGYNLRPSAEGFFLELPDQEELVSRWDRIRKSRPELELEPLHIKSSYGQASDEEFFQAMFEYDALLSTGREFVHDHFLHVMNTLELMIVSGKGYKELRSKRNDALLHLSRRIDNAVKCFKSPFREEVEKEGLKHRILGVVGDFISSHLSPNRLLRDIKCIEDMTLVEQKLSIYCSHLPQEQKIEPLWQDIKYAVHLIEAK